jgi:hypothetical protein
VLITLLANVAIAATQTNLIIFSKQLAEPDSKPTKQFLQTLYQLSDALAVFAFETVYVLRLVTISNIVYGDKKWVKGLWALFIIPLGYVASHMIALARIYDPSILGWISFTTFHNGWHVALAVYNFCSHLFLSYMVHASFNANFLNQEARNKSPTNLERLEVAYPIGTGILYMALAIWGANDASLGVGGAWFAFALDNISFLFVNRLIVKYLVAETRTSNYPTSNNGSKSVLTA